MALRRHLITFLLPIALVLFIQFSRLLELMSSSESVHDKTDQPLHVRRQEQPNARNISELVNTNQDDILGDTRGSIHTASDSNSSENIAIQSKTGAAEVDRSGSCLALKAHEKGHWHHNRVDNFSVALDKISIQQQYYPREIDWIKGTNLPPNFNKHQCNDTNPGEYYLTGLGNQCGCDASGFRPSFSSWVYNKAEDVIYATENSVLRLANQLIKTNSTLCFAGDSIDLQIYQSIQRQLERLRGLQQFHFNRSLNVSFKMREIPVDYSRPCGKLHAGFRPCGFKAMTSLKETVLADYNDDKSVGLVRYIKFYGWSPVSLLLVILSSTSVN